jgi:hypothetical protein
VQEGRLPVPPQIAARQLADAQAAAARADPRRGFALRFPRRQAATAAALLALLAASFAIPNPQEARLAQRQSEQEAIARQVERLERVREAIAGDDALRPADREALLRELDEAIRDLREGGLSREEAVARLSEAEGQLQALLDPDAEAGRAALEEAGRRAAQGETTRPVGQALAQDDYTKAAQALSDLGEGLPELSTAERAATAARLEAMADAVAGTQPELAGALDDAAAALRAGDVEGAQQALDRAAELTQQAGQQAAAQAAAQGAAEQALGQIQEGRRAIAQSGEGALAGQTGPDQAAQGPGQQGQGPSGDGSSGAGQAGSGSGDADGGGGTSGTPPSSGGPIAPNQPGQEGQTPYDRIYAPQRLGGEGGEQVDVPGSGESDPGGSEGEGLPPPERGEALVPYDEVYTDYQAQAASALENSYIPRGIKDYVRDYFSSLDPGPP